GARERPGYRPASHSAMMRLSKAASGSGPKPALQLSAMCAGLPVPGMTQATAAERHVDQDRDAALGRQRQQLVLRRAVVERIVELDEIERLLAHDGFELVIGARGIMRDAEVADATVLLPLPKRRKMCLPIEQVVHLHEVDALDLEQRERALHLRDSGLPPPGPHLGGDEGACGVRRSRQEVAEHGLGA